jgi:hypothetical protein
MMMTWIFSFTRYARISLFENLCLQSLFVTKIFKPPKVTPSLTTPLDFDLNLYPEVYHGVGNDFENTPKKAKKEYFPNNIHHIPNDYSEPKWKRNTFTYMPTPPDPPKLEVKPPKTITENNSFGLIPGRKFYSKEECMHEIGEQSLVHGFEYKPRKSDKYRYDVKCVHEGCDWVIITSKVDGSSEWEESFRKKVEDEEHQTRLEKEVAASILAEEATNEREWLANIKKEQDEQNEFFLEFGCYPYQVFETDSEYETD